MIEEILPASQQIPAAPETSPADNIPEKIGDATEQIPAAPPVVPPNTPTKKTDLKSIFGGASEKIAAPSTTAAPTIDGTAASPAEPAQLMKPENAERIAGFYVKYGFPFLTGVMNNFFIRTSKPEILELTRSEDEQLQTATVDLLLTMRDFGSPVLWFILTNASLMFGIYQRAARDKKQEEQAQELIRLRQAKTAPTAAVQPVATAPEPGSPLADLYANLPNNPPQEIAQGRARWETRYIPNSRGEFELHYTYTPKGKSEYITIEKNNASTLVSEPFRKILEFYGIDSTRNKKNVPNGKSLNYSVASAECNKYAAYFFDNYKKNAV